MKNDIITALDFRSGKITCFSCMPSPEGFIITGGGESAYGGYYEGEFLEEEQLAQAVASAITRCERGKEAIKKVYVGVPGEFTSVVTGEASLLFSAKKRITREDTMELLRKANLYSGVKGYNLISRSSIYYIINDETRTIDPVGHTASKLTVMASYIFLSDYFKECVDKALKAKGVEAEEYVSSCLTQALYLVDAQQRDNFAILMDVGYMSSSVVLIGGDGLLFLKSFSMGSGHIEGDLCEVLGCPFEMARQLFKSVNLNLEFGDKDNYTLKEGVEFNAVKTNEVVKARIEEIARYTIQCFEDCEYDIPPQTPIFLGGEGLINTKGAAEELTKCFGKQVKVIKTPATLTDKKEYASAYSLLDLACKQSAPQKKNFLNWLKRK